jgi:hypothetical protein
MKRKALRGIGIAAAFAAFTLVLGAQARMNAFFSRDFKDTAYQKAAVDKVLKNWSPPAAKPAVGQKTVLISKIGRDGKLHNLYFHVKTENGPWDDAAGEAVRKSGPFAPLPTSFKEPFLEVHWHFEVQP